MLDYKNKKNNNKDKVNINGFIKAKEVRLIDADGEMLGIVSLAVALTKAKEQGLDLVEVNPESKPPVCKILDYGKYKYLQQKKKQEAKKKQKVVILKELYVHLGIAEHDYQVKLRHLKQFLADGHKVKVSVKFRGREKAYKDKGVLLINRFYGDLGNEEGVKLDVAPKIEDSNVFAIFAPLTIKS